MLTHGDENDKPISLRESFSVEDPKKPVQPAPPTFNVVTIALSIIIALLLVVLIALLVSGRGESTWPGERRAHVITYADHTKGDGSFTAVEWRDRMPSPEKMAIVSRDGSLKTTSTAFVVRRGDNIWDAAFYSNNGTQYVFSGHSIQAAAYAQFQAFDEAPHEPLILKTDSNKPIIVTIDEDDNVIQEVDTEGRTKFFSRPIKEVVERLDSKIGEDQIAKFQEELLEALQISSESLASSGENIWVFHLGIVVLVDSEATLLEIKPDFTKMSALRLPGDREEGWDYNKSPFTHTRNIIVGTLLEGPVQFEYRVFCPRLGIPEDPVTGTGMQAMTTLYYSVRQEPNTWFNARQVSYSPGRLEGIWEPDGKTDRIQYRGPAVIRSIHRLPMKYKPDQPY